MQQLRRPLLVIVLTVLTICVVALLKNSTEPVLKTSHNMMVGLAFERKTIVVDQVVGENVEKPASLPLKIVVSYTWNFPKKTGRAMSVNVMHTRLWLSSRR